MLTRRNLLQGAGAFAAGGVSLTGYALAEPWRTGVVRYRIAPADWPAGLSLRLAVLADFHICEPWMGLDRLAGIVASANALKPDAMLLLGDYRAGYKLSRISYPVPDREWASALGGLRAPLGVHAVLGNHDWWDDRHVQEQGHGPTTARLALERAGVTVYDNEVLRLAKGGRPFWIAGLGDQWAFYGRFARGRRRNWLGYAGIDDVAGTMARISDDAPVILMAHEPDIFPQVPRRVALTLSGHTHGGQVRVLGYAPRIPSQYGRRYAYGHVVEDGRHLVVSGGLGCSAAPVRIGVPPEIVLVELGSAQATV